ncbi:MAG: pyruvate kinase [Nocardioides sp.]
MSDPDDQLLRVYREVDELRERVAAASTDVRLDSVHPSNRKSAENLLSYVALRQQDVRQLQVVLAQYGLSSLGRAEAHVRAVTEAVHYAVAVLAGVHPRTDRPEPVDFSSGAGQLDGQANALLGEPHGGRRTRIMVTLPSEAAADPAITEGIISAGAELVRINTAHDGPDDWRAMVRHVRCAEVIAGRSVKVVMDLAGPKIRTGPIATAPGVLHLRPERDDLGRVVTPVAVWLTTAAGSARPGAVSVPVKDPAWLARRAAGDCIAFRDTRGSRRKMRVVSIDEQGVLAELSNTAYLIEDLTLSVAGDVAAVGPIPPRDRKIPLIVGDDLILVRDLEPVDPTSRPPRIGCTLSVLFDDVRMGDRIFFDDGKIGGLIESCSPTEIRVQITDTAPGGARLGPAKGINLPDTTLGLPALSSDDLAHLPTVVELADAVSQSFVRTAEDVAELQAALTALGRPDLGLILKVETVAGFENLPEILLAALRSPHVGVMIARGDLAVEAGYARLAEVQEEILWLCEAAHVPVVWATQVLDGLARTGRPSRAEVTDAAMSGRAECVMLNKGPYVVDAVHFLDDVLTRMGEHQRKKSSLLRRLRAWGDGAPASGPLGYSSPV